MRSRAGRQPLVALTGTSETLFPTPQLGRPTPCAGHFLFGARLMLVRCSTPALLLVLPGRLVKIRTDVLLRKLDGFAIELQRPERRKTAKTKPKKPFRPACQKKAPGVSEGMTEKTRERLRWFNRDDARDRPPLRDVMAAKIEEKRSSRSDRRCPWCRSGRGPNTDRAQECDASHYR
jgi:hypothetical protein